MHSSSHPNEQVENIRSNAKERTLYLLDKVFPLKMTQLDRLYRILATVLDMAVSPVIGPLDPKDINAELEQLGVDLEHKENCFGLKGSRNLVEKNKVLVRANVKVNHEINQLLQYLSDIKIWVALNIPKKESGNNFFVDVQLELAALLDNGKSSAISYFAAVNSYYEVRSELVMEIRKYPNIMDLHKSIEELDRKQFWSTCNCCLDLRNNYCVLTDLILKNMDKLCNPRGTGDRPLY